MSDDRRDPNYQPQYMRKPSIRPANHQIGTPYWKLTPCWLWPWAELTVAAVRTMQDIAEALSGDDR